jgi:hypothetical protein
MRLAPALTWVEQTHSRFPSPRQATSGLRRSALHDRGKAHKPGAKEVLLGVVVGRDLARLAAFLAQAEAPLPSALEVVLDAHGSDHPDYRVQELGEQIFC